MAPTPLLGTGIDRASLPQATQVLGSQQIDRTNVPSLTGAFLEDVPSAMVNDPSGNPFQPDLLFRGFTAWPVAGTSQDFVLTRLGEDIAKVSCSADIPAKYLPVINSRGLQ